MKAKCIKPLCVDGYQFEEGKEYGITVTVGDVEKNITFKGGADAAASIKNIRT